LGLLVLSTLVNFFFLLREPPPSEVDTLSLHDALPIFIAGTVEEAGVDEHHALVGGLDARLEVDGGAALFVHDADFEGVARHAQRSEEHTSELQSRENLVCRLLLEKKK